MARLRTPASVASLALKLGTEGMGIRASGRVLEKSHVSIMRWEQRLADQQQQWESTRTSGRKHYSRRGRGLYSRG